MSFLSRSILIIFVCLVSLDFSYGETLCLELFKANPSEQSTPLETTSRLSAIVASIVESTIQATARWTGLNPDLTAKLDQATSALVSAVELLIEGGDETQSHQLMALRQMKTLLSPDRLAIMSSYRGASWQRVGHRQRVRNIILDQYIPTFDRFEQVQRSLHHATMDAEKAIDRLQRNLLEFQREFERQLPDSVSGNEARELLKIINETVSEIRQLLANQTVIRGKAIETIAAISTSLWTVRPGEIPSLLTRLEELYTDQNVALAGSILLESLKEKLALITELQNRMLLP